MEEGGDGGGCCRCRVVVVGRGSGSGMVRAYIVVDVAEQVRFMC